MEALSKKLEAIDANYAADPQMKEHVYLFKQATRAFDEKRYEDAVRILEMLTKHFSNDINARVMLALAYKYVGNPIKSIRLWENICEENPDDGNFSLSLALAYYDQEWIKKALAQLKTTVELTPDNRIAWEHLVGCSIKEEDDHEAKMNCFGAMYLLKEYGVESIMLNVYAFSFMVQDGSDTADKYLTAIIDIMHNGEKRSKEYYDDAIYDVLWEIDMAKRYELMPLIKEMVDMLPDISERLEELIMEVEIDAELAALEETFPEALCRLINLKSGVCNCEECKKKIMSLECSILVDHEGYAPELLRLSREYPKLYALHSNFFNEAVSGANRENLLKTRFRIMSDDGIEPILLRADGSEINPVVETYRRDGRKIGRNEMCPCGSGKKYKKCCSE